MVNERQRVRDAVAKLLSSPMTDARWAVFEDLGAVSATVAEISEHGGAISPNHPALLDLAEKFEAAYEANHRGRGVPQARQDGPRMLARSYVFAAMVAQDPRVIEFREAALGGALLLSLEAAERWIREQAALDETHAQEMLGAPLPLGLLYFQAPAASKLVDSLYTFPGSTLNTLRELVQWVTFVWPWTIIDAINFVLVGTVPLLKDVVSTLQHSENEEAPGAWRINLSVDPSTTPNEVAGWYKQERKRLLGIDMRDRRAKRMQPGHARRAVFWSIFQRFNLTTTMRMRLWNAATPADMRYAEGREWTFHRDMARAVEAVLRPSYLRNMHLDEVELRPRGERGN